ncbi:MAG: ADP-forming succinate--CoA ligase subunit beta [Rickettsiales bacterium]
MNIHEYQAKTLLKKFGAPVTNGVTVTLVDEIDGVLGDVSGPPYVVKAQIHAGGRGKGKFKEYPNSKGGVRFVTSKDALKLAAKEMLGSTLVTVQTGEEGKQVNRLYIQEAIDIKKEYYLSILVDRATGRVAFVASTEGGMDIEEVAEHHPEKIITITIDPSKGLSGFYIRQLAFALKLDKKLHRSFGKVVQGLYDAFKGTDAAQIEINPLAETEQGEMLVLDAKYVLDDNALFRHRQLEDLRDESEEDAFELRAKRFELSYVKMEGNIGCMVNGAGLAMATMDIIKLKGAEPANFLDVGGGATKERVTEAFKIITSDPNVQGILINIFGGIMRCDVIAEGVIAAAKEVGLNVPLVVRLEGTNVDKGKKLLKDSGLNIIAADDLEDAAEKAVAAIRKKAA